MKYVKQFFIILAISGFGELLSWLIPLPIPAGIYGILLLFAGLLTGIIPYDSVKETGHFLLDIMPIMFIPATVGLLDAWSLIRASWFPYTLLLVVTTIVVMGVSGRVTQHFTKKGADHHD